MTYLPAIVAVSGFDAFLNIPYKYQTIKQNVARPARFAELSGATPAMPHQPPDSLSFDAPPDPNLPEVASSGDGGCARGLVAVVSFSITGVITFYVVVFAFMRFNTLPRDEMSQGIVGGFFAVVLAVPVAVLIGACTAVLAVHAFDRLNGRVRDRAEVAEDVE
jgi:hypothetical protein